MRKKLFWIATAFLFLSFAVEDWAFYRPGNKRLNHLNAAISQSRGQILGHQFPAEQLQTVKALLERNSAVGGTNHGSQDYAAQSLGKLTGILKELQIELLSIVPKDIRQEGFFVVSPFEIEFRCGYHQFGRLLEAIERSRDLIDVREFHLSVVEEEAVVKLSVDIYLFK